MNPQVSDTISHTAIGILLGCKTWTQWQRCLFNITKQTWPPGSPYNPQSLTVTGSSQLTYPLARTLVLRGLGCFSLYNPNILVICPLSVFGLPGCCTCFPLSLPLMLPFPPSPSPSPAQSGQVHSRCPASGYALPHICNKLPPPPDLQEVISFSFYFFLFVCFHLNRFPTSKTSRVRTLGSQ